MLVVALPDLEGVPGTDFCPPPAPAVAEPAASGRSESLSDSSLSIFSISCLNCG